MNNPTILSKGLGRPFWSASVVSAVALGVFAGGMLAIPIWVHWFDIIAKFYGWPGVE